MWSSTRKAATILATCSALVLGIMGSSSYVAAAPATAAPQETYFNIHIRTDPMTPQCVHNQPFGRDGSHCMVAGYFDGGHSQGFNDVAGRVSYDGFGVTTVRLNTAAGSYIEGQIPSRGSGEFTVNVLRAPEFGALARPRQLLHLNVVTREVSSIVGSYFDFYLSGKLLIEPAPRGPGAPLRNGFGSSA